MNVTARIGKVIRTVGLMGIMMALAGFMVSANSAPASAATISPTPSLGKVVVAIKYETPDAITPEAGVLIYDEKGNVVAKGIATMENSFAAKLQPGMYKVSVSAPGFSNYSSTVKVASNYTSYVEASLGK